MSPSLFDAELPLYFQHIPKTAGTSVATALAAAYPRDQICPVAHWDTIVRIPREQLDRYRVFIGHYSAYLPRYLGRRLNSFTLLRDPIERTISHYAFIRRDKTHPFHDIGSRQTLREFVLSEETRPNVVNYQARYVANLGVDTEAVARDVLKNEPGGFPLQMAIDECSLSSSPATLREAALTALNGFFQIGLAETFESEMKKLGRTLGRDLDASVRANVSPDRSHADILDEATLAAIQDATLIDQELIACVRARSAGAPLASQ